MLLVQKYLENNSFGNLARDHGVYASFSKSGHKFSLNYDQIEAKESDPLAQECRGLVLSLEDGSPIFGQVGPDGKINRDGIEPGKTKILAYPMRRFFNAGQGACANVNWNDPNLSIMEKLDGTLIILYYDPFTHAWCAATRSVPEADLLMDNGIYTFRTLFEKALKETCGLSFNDYTDKLDRYITYCFELTTPLNRIVVKYEDYKVTLLAARQNIYIVDLSGSFNPETQQYSGGNESYSLDELDINDIDAVDSFGVPKVKTYKYSSLEEIVNWVSTLNPSEHEGVVVRDSNFNRIKIKNAAYVAFSKIRDVLSTSERNCMELILLEKEDDSIPFLPREIVDNLLKIKSGLQATIKLYDDVYLAMKAEADAINLGDKKTFALLVTQNKKIWQTPLFQIFSGKAKNMKDFIAKNRKDGTWGDSFLDKLLELSKITTV